MDVAAVRQADLEVNDDDDEEEYEDEKGMSAVLRLPALRVCITPEEGEVPRELLLATIALAASAGPSPGCQCRSCEKGALMNSI